MSVGVVIIQEGVASNAGPWASRNNFLKRKVPRVDACTPRFNLSTLSGTLGFLMFWAPTLFQNSTFVPTFRGVDRESQGHVLREIELREELQKGASPFP